MYISYLHNENNQRSDMSLHDWPHNDKTDLQPYLFELSLTCDSFIPSRIGQWNSLNPSLRNVEYISKFKTELRKQKDIRQVPKHYETGHRKLNIALTQLRCFAKHFQFSPFSSFCQ
jgi:hypothetical protein